MATKKVQQFFAGGMMYILLFAAGKEKIGGGDHNEKCGGEDRWQQKVLIDPLADSINVYEKETTIEAISAIDTKAPKNRFGHNKPRMQVERQVYSIKNCFITDILRESDNDLHLVIEDGKGNHMIAEIPDPECPQAQQSNWAGGFEASRDTLLSYSSNYRHYTFTISGVLFVDKEHNQTGRGNNNIEMHPILSLKKEKAINF